MGKTQLAIRFARDHRDDFTAIFWLSGKDRNALLQSLGFALNRLSGQGWDSEATNDREVEQRAGHMLRWLALDGNSRWLIIFDNIDQYSPLLTALLVRDMTLGNISLQQTMALSLSPLDFRALLSEGSLSRYIGLTLITQLNYSYKVVAYQQGTPLPNLTAIQVL